MGPSSQGGLRVARVVPSAGKVPGENATASCFNGDLTILLEGVLARQSDSAELTIAPTTIEIAGDFHSVGDAANRCPCQPDCAGRSCGEDGCEGSCGACDQYPSSFCNSTGQCDCAVDCAGKECGDDACGGSCDTCPACHHCDGATFTCEAEGTCQPSGRVVRPTR